MKPPFRGYDDLSHQGVLAVLRVKCILAVCETPRLFYVGFLHRADKGSHAALLDQSQRLVDLCAALRGIVSESWYCLQRDRVLFRPYSGLAVAARLDRRGSCGSGN